MEFRGFSSGRTGHKFSEHFPPTAENSDFIFCPDGLLTGKRRIELLPRKCNRWALMPPIRPHGTRGFSLLCIFFKIFRSLFRTRISLKSHTSSGGKGRDDSSRFTGGETEAQGG